LWRGDVREVKSGLRQTQGRQFAEAFLNFNSDGAPIAAPRCNEGGAAAAEGIQDQGVLSRARTDEF